MKAAIEDHIKGLPPYLGFGVLDPSSISETEGTLTARYTLGKETVYEVSVAEERSEIVEYFDGKQLGRSRGRRLGEAFLLHMFGLSMDEHPRLRKLVSQIRAGRNTYINLYEGQGFVTFPAGYLISLRLPITNGNRVAWEALTDRLREAGEAAPLKLEALTEGFILKLTASGAVLREAVAIADSSTLLFHLKDAIDLICESGVVPAERERRLTVLPVEQFAGGKLTVYPGVKNRGFLTFSILQVTQAEMEEYGVEDLFREVSLKLVAPDVTNAGRKAVHG